MDSERPFQSHGLDTAVFLESIKSSQLVVEKTFSRKKAHVKQARVLNGHRSVIPYALKMHTVSC